MVFHITCLNGHFWGSTAQIAQHTTARIAREMGFQQMNVRAYPVYTDSEAELRTRIHGVIAGLSAGDYVVVQSPTWNDLAFEEALVNNIRSYPEVKLAIYIHDVQALMFEGNYYLLDRLIAMYNRADLVIVATEAMYQRLVEAGLTVQNYVVQEMWDHPHDLWLARPQFAQEIQFAGNPDKFHFVQDWHYQTPLRIYADAKDKILPEKVTMAGFMMDTELLVNLNRGGFGLVWTDESYTNDYMKLCITHKLGSYLAAGLPVIVSHQLANASIVQENNLGLVVNSLAEADDLIQTMTEDEYNHLVDQVKKFQPLITQGYFTRRVLTETIIKLSSYYHRSTH